MLKYLKINIQFEKYTWTDTLNTYITMQSLEKYLTAEFVINVGILITFSIVSKLKVFIYFESYFKQSKNHRCTPDAKWLTKDLDIRDAELPVM